MQNFFFVKNGRRYTQVFFSDIQYLEARDKHTIIVTAKETHLIPQLLCTIGCALPAKLFCRIHRSYIISLLHTKWFDDTRAFVADKKLPIGKLYKSVLPGRVATLTDEPQKFVLFSSFDMLNFSRDIKPG